MIPFNQQKPNRCYELSIRIGGDTWADVARQLEELARQIIDHGPECKSVGGSPSVGHVVEVHHHPEQTHEKYFADLEVWIKGPHEAIGVADSIQVGHMPPHRPIPVMAT